MTIFRSPAISILEFSISLTLVKIFTEDDASYYKLKD
jgi:hypothetical protein